MADFYPREIEQPRVDGDERLGNESERTVRRQLEAALHDLPWVVIQNLVVQESDRVGMREIDFLVIDPTRGMIVIEVKGGLYGYSRELGWHRKSGGGVEQFRTGALQQATSAMHILVRTVATRRLHDSVHPPYLHSACVALPDAMIVQDTLPLEAQGRVLDSRACADPTRLHALLEDYFAALAQRYTEVPCGEDSEMRAILDEVLLPEAQARRAIRTEISNSVLVERDTLRPLRSIVETAQEIDRIRVRGFPGTGKTFAALERLHLDRAQDRRTLLLAFNIPLVASLTARLRLPAVRSTTPAAEVRASSCVVARIFALADIAAAGRTDLPSDPTQDDYFRARLPILVEQARAGLFGRFDSVIVDEGQDFSSAMLDAVDALACHTSGTLGRIAFFHDPNQRIYQTASEDELVRRYGQPHVLRENLRNSRAICEFLGTLAPERLRGLRPPPSARDGQPVVVFEFEAGNNAAQLEALTRIVRHLVEAEGVRSADIALLSPFRRDRTVLAGVEEIRGLPILSLEEAARRGREADECLRHETLHRFKGLETPVVILHDVRGSAENVSYEAILTACSRAQHALYVLRATDYAGSALLPVQGTLP